MLQTHLGRRNHCLSACNSATDMHCRMRGEYPPEDTWQSADQGTTSSIDILHFRQQAMHPLPEDLKSEVTVENHSRNQPTRVADFGVGQECIAVHRLAS